MVNANVSTRVSVVVRQAVRKRTHKLADFTSSDVITYLSPMDVSRKIQLQPRGLLFLESIEQRPARYLFTLAILLNWTQRFGIPFHQIISQGSKDQT
jgi:hypothetical protein